MSKGFIGSQEHQVAREKDYLDFINEGWTLVHERSLRFGGIGGYLACVIWLLFGTMSSVMVTILIQGPHDSAATPKLEVILSFGAWLFLGLFYLRWRGWAYALVGTVTGGGVIYGCYQFVGLFLPSGT